MMPGGPSYCFLFSFFLLIDGQFLDQLLIPRDFEVFQLTICTVSV